MIWWIWGGFRPPGDPLQRFRLEKWCGKHLNLALETNYKSISWQLPGRPEINKTIILHVTQ